MSGVAATGPTFASESELWEAHLKPAPAELQDRARAYFKNLVNHYGKTSSELTKREPSLARTREQADARFMQRLSELCVAALADGAGLLLVDGQSYDKRVRGKKYQAWFGGGIQRFGRTVGVLVVIDTPDEVLTRIDAEFWDLRAVEIAEMLTGFNSSAFSVRADRLAEFDRSGGKGSFFGVSQKLLPFIEIDRTSCIVLPKGRW